MSPTTAELAGVAVFAGGSGDLDDRSGVLRFEGTVDLVSGLSTYDYVGVLSSGS